MNKEEETFPYNLKSPQKVMKMPSDLEEISGIAYMGNGQLACVQDEKGRVYVFDMQREKVVRKVDFAKDGDFEDLAFVGDTLFVVRSDGKLYRINEFFEDEPDDQSRKTPLSARNDVEGLAYDMAHNRLLLACKEEAAIEGKMKNRRAVYAVDLSTYELQEKPVLVIDLDEVAERAGEKIAFMPSAISVHPFSGEWYILSSVGKLLLVFTPEGDFKLGKKLDSDDFRQPEGICFKPDGTLFISNEGKGGKADIQVFSYQK